MTDTLATIELRDLQLATAIGTYGPGDVVPDAHVLDLTLTIAPDLVLVARDDMALIFDYDPLIAEIDRIARAQRYETQEYLMTRPARPIRRSAPWTSACASAL
jgi:dihydroneopterin aldolase